MHDLRQRLATMADRYAELLAAADSQRTHYGYAGEEFFRLRPFYIELSQMNPAVVHFAKTPEEAVGHSRISCAFGNGRLLHCRDWHGPNVYYDSFFEYEGQLSRRYFCYVNNGDVGPKSVEELLRAESGLPLRYRCVGIFGDEEAHYRCTEYGLEETTTTFDEALQPYRTLTRQFEFDQLHEVRAAYEITPEGREPIFDAAHKAKNLDALAAEAAQQLTTDILDVATSPVFVDRPVACLVLEYSLQHPVPPSFGFGQQGELDSPDGEDPASSLSAPDFELFYQLGRAHSDLYDELNARIRAWEREEYEAFEASAAVHESRAYESHRFVFDFYVRLCKALRRRIGRTSLPIQRDFFVVFRSLEYSEIHAALEATLPKRAWARWKHSIQAAEHAQAHRRDTHPDHRETQEAMAAALLWAQEFLASFTDAGLTMRYNREQLLTIRPFGYEIEKGDDAFADQRSLARGAG